MSPIDAAGTVTANTVTADTATTDTQTSADPRFYRFAADGAVTILGSRSDETGTLFWPPRLRCPITGGTVSDVELATTGTIFSWTFVYMPWQGEVLPGPAHGYSAGLVDLDDDGPRLAVVLLGDLGTWAVGDRARALALPLGPGANQSILAFEKIAP